MAASRTERREEILGDLNAMSRGWVTFDAEWARALKGELEELKAAANEPEG